MATDRTLQGAAATLSAPWYSGEDLADPGSVTVTVDAADGTEVVSSTAASGTGAAARTLALTSADTAALTVLTATWTSATLGVKTTAHEIVGGFYLELADIRALGGLTSTARHTTAELAAARAWFETLAEQWCDVAFVPRYGKVDVYRRYGDPVYLKPMPRTVQAASVDDAAIGTSGWVLESDGHVAAVGGLPPLGRLVVHHTHGYDRPDDELVEAAKVAIRSKLLTDQSNMPSRQVLLTNELGTVRLAQPGKTAATGIPEVDRVLNDRRFSAALIG